MKKLLLSFLALTLIATVSTAQDEKAFAKGRMTVSLGAGFGIYGTKVHTEYDQQVPYWNGSSIAWETRRYTNDTTDGAISAIYPLTFEYGVTNWLGLGARFAYSGYFQETDSISGVQSKVRAMDVDFVANFHLVKSRRFDMPICVTIGYSNIHFWSNDPANSQAKDNGLNYGIGLMPRIYFGNHIGMFFNLGYVGYNYPSFVFFNDTDSNLNSVNNWKYSLKGNGLNMGIGLIGKF